MKFVFPKTISLIKYLYTKFSLNKILYIPTFIFAYTYKQKILMFAKCCSEWIIHPVFNKPLDVVCKLFRFFLL